MWILLNVIPIGLDDLGELSNRICWTVHLLAVIPHYACKNGHLEDKLRFATRNSELLCKLWGGCEEANRHLALLVLLGFFLLFLIRFIGINTALRITLWLDRLSECAIINNEEFTEMILSSSFWPWRGTASENRQVPVRISLMRFWANTNTSTPWKCNWIWPSNR